ncbi:amidophosphoribosyltransferase [Actinomyces sp. 2119]|uniref:Amidophosphoribosyltransferase n=1 Tax=Actinomyces lilanjuaniae TaxID=2321394 RepID=A0ABM6Z1N4_9ACTO|nr:MULTISPECIES: amidophosphoribosyltransferase [Actinomyces]AYD89136.1 amidophosphoribosyltransferase [Actinomyces lilanjuaniae]RJF42022.1 amidophosphoribosyltransferase [Actinomyces sp. 2119]
MDSPPAEECGVFGVWAPGEEVSRLTYFGLYALQHRGQEAAGIATSNGSQILVYKDLGLVSQVFDDLALTNLSGHIAVGHVRYATTGATTWENAQPMLGPASGSTLALAHNGNLTNTRELVEAVHATSGEDLTGELGRGSSTDTAVIAALMNLVGERGALEGWDSAADVVVSGVTDEEELTQAYSAPAPLTLHQAARRVLPMLRGAFSLVFMDERTLYAARDPQGIRPLVLGRLERGWTVASETAALDIVGATFVREVEPGELLEIDDEGVRSTRFAAARRAGCVFEYVYLARPDTRIAGRSVNAARNAMGAALAREHPVEADLIIATPESGTPAAIGYAQASGIPYGQGLVKNAYVGRTFIQPTQTLRQLGIRLKLNPLREVIEGRRLVVVDDSIVRGNTQRALVRMLREAGAAEVHVRISSPPVLWPCFYGIDFATRAELIAAGMSVDQICHSIGADTLGFLSVNGMVEATGQQRDSLCIACFTGDYPVPPPVAGASVATIPVSPVPAVYRRRPQGRTGRGREDHDRARSQDGLVEAAVPAAPQGVTRPDLRLGSPPGSGS